MKLRLMLDDQIRFEMDLPTATPPAETCEQRVRRLYREEQNREPDPGGLIYWIGRCENGMGEASMRSYFRPPVSSVFVQPPHQFNLHWSDGNQVEKIRGAEVGVMVEVPPDWMTRQLEPGYTRSFSIKSSFMAGPTVDWVTYTINGKTSAEFMGKWQGWTYAEGPGGDPDFPVEALLGPFVVVVRMYNKDPSGAHIPVNDATLSIQINHYP